MVSKRFTIVVLSACFAGVLASGRAVCAQQTECAPDYVLENGLCYPPCPQGFVGSGLVCTQSCAAASAGEGAACEQTQPRGSGQLTRSAYRDLFWKFVQLYRAGAVLLAQPLTADEKTYLRQFFPARLVDSVRVTMVPMMEFPFVMNVKATTIGNDLIVVKDGQRSNELLKHELVHACQADRAGLDRFIRDYADQYVDGGYSYMNIGFEREAYGFEQTTGAVSAYLGYCE